MMGRVLLPFPLSSTISPFALVSSTRYVKKPLSHVLVAPSVKLKFVLPGLQLPASALPTPSAAKRTTEHAVATSARTRRDLDIDSPFCSGATRRRSEDLTRDRRGALEPVERIPLVAVDTR